MKNSVTERTAKLINKQLISLCRKRDKLFESIQLLQSICPHPTPTKRYRGDTGNYDKSEDTYWIEWHCPDCEKHWTSSQLDRMELTKYPNAIKIS